MSLSVLSFFSRIDSSRHLLKKDGRGKLEGLSELNPFEKYPVDKLTENLG